MKVLAFPQVDGRMTIKLSGKIDLVGADAAEAAVRRGAMSADYLCLDLTEVTFLGSRGLRAIVLGLRILREKNGRLAVKLSGTTIGEILVTSGLHDHLIIESQ